MAEPATRRMTLDAFLAWNDGSDTRYELIAGFPVAMPPPSEAHGMLAVRLAARLEAALANRRPCRAAAEAGILDPDRADAFFVADIGVTCAPYDARRQHMQDPILLIEILSPSTERHDRRVKVPAYRRIQSVQEILLVDADGRYAELHRRHGDVWIIQIGVGDGSVISPASIGSEISMSELYEGLTFPEDQQVQT
jgi:Uma2 family endonuclease